jgi:hypothetical protein
MICNIHHSPDPVSFNNVSYVIECYSFPLVRDTLFCHSLEFFYPLVALYLLSSLFLPLWHLISSFFLQFVSLCSIATNLLIEKRCKIRQSSIISSYSANMNIKHFLYYFFSLFFSFDGKIPTHNGSSLALVYL